MSDKEFYETQIATSTPKAVCSWLANAEAQFGGMVSGPNSGTLTDSKVQYVERLRRLSKQRNVEAGYDPNYCSDPSLYREKWEWERRRQ